MIEYGRNALCEQQLEEVWTGNLLILISDCRRITTGESCAQDGSEVGSEIASSKPTH
jgi:hypothetical protein